MEWNSLLIQKDISPDEVDLEYAEFTKEYDHAFLEELSWRKQIDTQMDFPEDNANILVKYCFSEWTTKRFKNKSIVCLSSEICQMLELTFDVDRLAYTFANEDVSTSFICDDSKLPDTIEEPEIRYNHKVSHNSYSAIPIKRSIDEQKTY